MSSFILRFKGLIPPIVAALFINNNSVDLSAGNEICFTSSKLDKSICVKVKLGC